MGRYSDGVTDFMNRTNCQVGLRSGTSLVAVHKLSCRDELEHCSYGNRDDFYVEMPWFPSR